MRLAYADPPYIGQARRHYANDPSGVPAEEVDHEALLDLLQGYDGWALSASSPSVFALAGAMPPGTRIGAWSKPFCSWKPSNRVQYTWEPVFFVPARPRGGRGIPSVRDHVVANMTIGRGTHGAKPDAFCEWILGLLGCEPGDAVDDLFPGSGAFSMVAERRGARVTRGIKAVNEMRYDDETRARSEAQTRTILEHLREGVHRGQVYFRSADVADALGMSTQCVGSRIGSAARSGETGGLRIEKWTQAVWRVTAGVGP